MKICILTESTSHPIYQFLEKWVKENSITHDISLKTNIDSVTEGDILFLISFLHIVKKEIRHRFKHTLVIHASDLPVGKGWSPHIWEILKGNNKITVSLLEAEDKVDSGNIWKKKSLLLEGHELFDEINSKLFAIELELMDFAVDNCLTVKPIKQIESEVVFYPKRTPIDSELNPNMSIVEQFDLMRVCDENRYPAFFYFKGYRYKIVLKKY